MTFTHNTIIVCSQIFWSHTDYILGTYVTKMIVISSPEKYYLITWIRVILRYSWKYLCQTNLTYIYKIPRLSASQMTLSFRLTFPVEISPPQSLCSYLWPPNYYSFPMCFGWVGMCIPGLVSMPAIHRQLGHSLLLAQFLTFVFGAVHIFCQL